MRGIHAHNRAVEERPAPASAVPSTWPAAFPEGAEPGRGDWLIDPACTSRSAASISPSPCRAPRRRRCATGLPVHLHLGTEDVVGRLAVLGARRIAPGEAGFVQVDFDRADRRAVGRPRHHPRSYGARTRWPAAGCSIRGPPRRGRSRPERLAALAALAEPDAGDALERLLDGAGIVALAPFALARNLPQAEVEALADGRRVSTGSAPAPPPIALSPEHLARLGDSIVERLGGMAPRPARCAGAGARRPVRPAARRGARGRARCRARRTRRGGERGARRRMWRLPEHRPRLTNADEKLWERVRPLLAAAELRPPRVREVAEALALEPEPLDRFLNRAERFGRVAPVAANRFFLPETVARLAELAASYRRFARGHLHRALFKDRSGIGRNLTIEVLEYLDTIGVTRRVGDARVALLGDAAGSAGRGDLRH